MVGSSAWRLKLEPGVSCIALMKQFDNTYLLLMSQAASCSSSSCFYGVGTRAIFWQMRTLKHWDPISSPGHPVSQKHTVYRVLSSPAALSCPLPDECTLLQWFKPTAIFHPLCPIREHLVILRFRGLTGKVLPTLVGTDWECVIYRTASYSEDYPGQYVDSRESKKSKSVLIPFETEEALLTKPSRLIDYFIIIQYESSLIS